MDHALDNPNPHVRKVVRESSGVGTRTIGDVVFDVIRDIKDPEHPHTLEELSVVQRSSVAVREPAHDSPGYGDVCVTFTPTVPHCSMASVIGLSIRAKLDACGVLNPRGEHYYKLRVECEPGAHATAESITKQLSDKERVSAAFENPTIMSLLDACVNNIP